MVNLHESYVAALWFQLAMPGLMSDYRSNTQSTELPRLANDVKLDDD